MKKKTSLIGFVSCVLMVLFFFSSTVFAETWTREDGERVANGNYHNPDVVQLDDGSYRMYYQYTDAGSTDIYSMSSTDGLTWTDEDGIRVEDGGAPTVIALPDGDAAGSWRMYYKPSGADTLKSAVSNDGLVFAVEDGTRLEASGTGNETAGVAHPSAILLPDDSYRIYYEGHESENSDERILSASSDDGLTFTRDSGVRLDFDDYSKAEGFISPYIILTSDGTYRIYTHMDSAETLTDGGVYLATSSDGLSFTLEDNYEIADLWPDDDYSSQDPSVIEYETGSLRMYYWIGGGSTLAESAIYSATATLGVGDDDDDDDDDNDDSDSSSSGCSITGSQITKAQLTSSIILVALFFLTISAIGVIRKVYHNPTK